MQVEAFRLPEFYPRLKTSVFEATLTAYCPDNSPEIDSERRRPTVIVCPGGGYEFTSDREAEPVALHFVSLGYNAFVLRYSVAPSRYPQALLELAASVAFVRKRAEQYLVKPDAVAVCGFSAGGHLACSLGVFWHEPFISDTLGVGAQEIRPDVMLLGYPVITSGVYAHRGSFDALLGKDAPQELVERFSLEKRVTAGTPPAFIWHTFDDDCVPVENSLLLAQALRAHQVTTELHIFPQGPHGLSLCDARTAGPGASDLINPQCAAWVRLCDAFLQHIFGA